MRELGRYKLLERINRGGMADVFLGLVPGGDGRGRTVAVKLLRADISNLSELVPMFMDEAKLSISLKHPNITNFNDGKLNEFDLALNKVLLNLAKRVVADGEGASKFISIHVKNCKTEIDAKRISFSVANSPLVKTAIAGEDPNWGRIIMALGKAKVKINLNKLNINIGPFIIIENGKISNNYIESDVAEYMKSYEIKINIQIGTGKKEFEVYTMDLTKKYIEINGDYRS